MPSRIDFDAVPETYKTDRRWAEMTRAQREAAVRFSIGTDLAGTAVGNGLKVAGKRLTFTDPESLVALLRAGITVQVLCWDTGVARKRQHNVRFARNGAVQMLDHGPVDLDAEMMLGALGGNAQPCLMMAALLPGAAPLPSWASAGRQAIESRLRPLHTAVAWAQDPDTDWTLVKEHHLCDLGITPAVMQAWLDAGFTIKTAQHFWAAGASLDSARPWLAARQTSKSAASEAARGHRPDDHAQWRAVGFTLAGGLPWQRYGYAPQEARALADDGFTATTHRWAVQGGLSSAEAVAWARAGVPAGHVSAWHTYAKADRDTAVLWSAIGVTPDMYRRLGHTPNAFRTMSFTEAKAWVEAEFPPEVLPVLLNKANRERFTVQGWWEFRFSPMAEELAPRRDRLRALAMWYLSGLEN